MDEEGRVGILMCAGCAFVCVFLFVSIALTEVAMQARVLCRCPLQCCCWLILV